MRHLLPARARALLAVIGVLALLAGCGGDGSSDEAEASSTEETRASDDDGTTTEATTDADDDATDTSVTDDGPTDDGPTDDGPTDDGPTDDGEDVDPELASILLTTDDLPDGFTQEPGETEMVEEGDEGLCEGEAVGEFPEPAAEASRDFEDEAELLLIGSQVGRFPDGDGEAVMQLYRDEVTRCAGQPGYSVTEVPGIGDEALLIEITDPEAPWAIEFNVARVGDLVMFVGILGDPAGAPDGTDLLGVMVERAEG